MNKRWKNGKKSTNSPVLFEDEEVGTLSPNDVKTHKLFGTPHRSKSYTSDHSTPIKTKHKTDSSDSPNLMYTESPIEPLTQNPPNEVGWDYQRVLLKEEHNGKSSMTYMDISRTPKRSDLLSKKRNSNSPLLYKPLKKKLIQEEQQEHIAGFMAELKAIEIKTKLDEEKIFKSVKKTDNDLESQLIVEMDSQPSGDSDIKLQVSANSDDSTGQNKITVKIKNYDALLDDSIEDIMVLCSQQVEAEEFGIKNVPSALKNPEKNNTENSSKSSDNSLEKMFKNLAKENIQPANTSDRINSDLSSEKSLGKTESGSLEIPDDSFDEFFVGIDEKDFCKNTEIIIYGTNKPVNRSHKNMVASLSSTTTNNTNAKCSVYQNKFFQSKKPVINTQPKSTITTTSIFTPNSQSSSVPVQNKIANSKANYGYLNREYAKYSSGYESQSSQSSNGNYNTRLVKAKSFSDSDFEKNSTGNNFGNYRGYSYLNSEKKLQSVGLSGNTFGSIPENRSWRRTNSTSYIDDKKYKINNLNGEKSYSTPAEIEKKRQEALQKRAAKMKFDNTTQSRPMQDLIKR